LSFSITVGADAGWAGDDRAVGWDGRGVEVRFRFAGFWVCGAWGSAVS